MRPPGMSPSQVSAALRRIAAGIDRSRSPRPAAVAADLEEVAAAVATPLQATSLGTGTMHRVTGTTKHGWDVDASLWVPDEGPEGIEWLGPVPSQVEVGTGQDWDEVVVLL